MTGRVAIIGGGFTGAAVALNLIEVTTTPLHLTIIEPGDRLGHGVAYGTTDPDHRLNGPSFVHFLSLSDHGHFTRWYAESGAQAADRESAAGPWVFPRRRDFGTYVSRQIEAAMAGNTSSNRVEHLRTRAIDVVATDRAAKVKVADGPDVEADLVVLTTSNAAPAIPAALRPVSTDERFVRDPWVPDALSAMPHHGKVLIIGTGLTMADVVVTLRRERPDLELTAISRRGLLPRSLPLPAEPPPDFDLVEMLTSQQPAFVTRHPEVKTVRGVLRLVRSEIRKSEAEGGSWHAAFDEVRDAAHVLWPSLAPEEQERFVRHLSAWYEVHRFRYPPQTERVIRSSIEADRLNVQAARVVTARSCDDGIEVTTRSRANAAEARSLFTAVINCTGPERTSRDSGDPLLANMVSGGHVTANPFGLGLQVDALSRARRADGAFDDRLRVVGPLCRGQFGESMGAPHIVARLTDALPSMLDVITN